MCWVHDLLSGPALGASRRVVVALLTRRLGWAWRQLGLITSFSSSDLLLVLLESFTLASAAMRVPKGFILLAFLAASSCEAKSGSAPKTLSKARAKVLPGSTNRPGANDRVGGFTRITRRTQPRGLQFEP
jgi:hypothetical protein